MPTNRRLFHHVIHSMECFGFEVFGSWFAVGNWNYQAKRNGLVEVSGMKVGLAIQK